LYGEVLFGTCLISVFYKFVFLKYFDCENIKFLFFILFIIQKNALIFLKVSIRSILTFYVLNLKAQPLISTVKKSVIFAIITKEFNITEYQCLRKLIDE